MIGTYKIPLESLNEMKGAFRFSFIIFLVIAYFIYVLLIIVRGEPDMLTSLLIATGLFTGMLLLFLIINAFQHRPLYNTIIQITDNEIIRSGEGLRTVRLRYDEIGTISNKIIGTLLIKKGFLTKLDLYTRKYNAYSNTSGVILIPLSIENYQDIVRYVRLKSKCI